MTAALAHKTEKHNQVSLFDSLFQMNEYQYYLMSRITATPRDDVILH
jgi:hypothetical protein